MSDIKEVAVLGTSGYVGQELLKKLLSHPKVKVKYIFSRSHKGKKLKEVFPLFINSDLEFTAYKRGGDIPTDVDFAFFALPHGLSQKYVENFSKKKCKSD